MLLAVLLFLSGQAQQTQYLLDPAGSFKQAKEYYQQGSYALAYPMFLQMKAQLKDADKSQNPTLFTEIHYYQLVCALKLGEKGAAEQAQEFIDLGDHQPRIEMMYFHLAQYHFRQGSYFQALSLFEKANPRHLSDEEQGEMSFQRGYAYFYLQRFAEAKPLFEQVRMRKSDPHYADAQYYYSFILFSEGNYGGALEGFREIESHPVYGDKVAFYIATILYNTGKQEEALSFVENQLKQNRSTDAAALHQLAGHAWFERKQYSKALGHFEAYAAQAKSLSRQDLYEMSYTQYNVQQYTKSIEGFKQLSEGEDSLSQNAMYLLGDAYLKSNQKANARNAFLFCASNSSIPAQKEIAQFQYAKLSYELKYRDIAQSELEKFITAYPQSEYQKEARELLVAVLAGTSNYKDALTLLESIPNPTDRVQKLMPKVYFGRASELMNDGLLVTANGLFEKSLSGPFAADLKWPATFWKAEIAYRLNKTDEAQRLWTDYVEHAQSKDEQGEANLKNAHYNLAYCFFRKESYAQALAHYSRVVSTPKSNSNSTEQDAWMRMADCHYMSRNYSQAAQMYDQVIRLAWPGSDYASLQKAMIAGMNRSSDKIKLLQTVEQRYPGSPLIPDVQMEIANTYLSDEQFKASIPYLQKVVANPNNESIKPKALMKLGIAYYNSDQHPKALEQYQRILQSYPNSIEAEDALENLQAIYLEEGRSAEYVKLARSLGKDIARATEDSLAYAEAERKFSNGDFNGALSQFDQYLSRFPDGLYVVDAYYYRSEIFNNRKDWPKAVEGYQEVANRVPNRFGDRSLLQSARLNYFELKNYERAALYYQKLQYFAANQDQKLEAMRGLLRCRQQLQQWDSAARTATEVLQEKGISGDDKAIAYFSLAKAAQADKQTETAISFYKSVLQQNKGALAAESRYEIAAILAANSRWADAEKAAFETIQKSGSYEQWVVKSYILLGDIYYAQKDFFNAKATYQSVLDNTQIVELRKEAGTKLQAVTEAEKLHSPIRNEKP